MAYRFAFELETLSQRAARAARTMGQNGAVLFFMAFGLLSLVGSFITYRRRNDPAPFLSFDDVGVTKHTGGHSHLWIRWDEIQRLDYSGKSKENVHLFRTNEILGPQVVIPAHATDRSGQEIFDHIAKRRPDLLTAPPEGSPAIDSTKWTGELFDRFYPSSKHVPGPK